jgi:hypothetical protein
MARHRHTRATLALLLALTLALVGLRPTPARAVNFCEVTHNGSIGGQDFQVALIATNCPTVTFAPGVTEVTASAYYQLSRDVTIQGPSGTRAISPAPAASS